MNAREPIVTEVRIRLAHRPPVIAVASITLWNAIAVHDIRILERKDGSLAVLMPRQPGPTGGWTPVAHPILEETRLAIEREVLAALRAYSAEPRTSAAALRETAARPQPLASSEEEASLQAASALNEDPQQTPAATSPAEETSPHAASSSSSELPSPDTASA